MNRKERRTLQRRQSRKVAAKLQLPKNVADEPAALRQHGDELVCHHRYSEAAEVYRKAVTLNPNHARTWGCLGFALTRHRRRSEALECYREAAALEPNDIAIAHDLGTLLMADKKHEESASLFERVLRLKPELPEAHYRQNVMWRLEKNESTKHYKTCVRTTKAALAAQPHNANLAVNAGISLVNMDMPQDALDWFKLALQIDPGHIMANYQMGETLRILKKFGDA